MLYAVDADGTRSTAEPTLKATCPQCKGEVRAKCGKIKTWHWAHVAKDCDPWSEPESEWHLGWKSLFPKECCEVSMGPHRADVKINGTVIEFQKSSISPEEIAERESFYGQMVWVLDGSSFLENMEIKRRIQDDRTWFWWKWPRLSWMFSKKPIFIDCSSMMGEFAVPDAASLFSIKQLRQARSGRVYGEATLGTKSRLVEFFSSTSTQQPDRLQVAKAENEFWWARHKHEWSEGEGDGWDWNHHSNRWSYSLGSHKAEARWSNEDIWGFDGLTEPPSNLFCSVANSYMPTSDLDHSQSVFQKSLPEEVARHLGDFLDGYSAYTIKLALERNKHLNLESAMGSAQAYGSLHLFSDTAPCWSTRRAVTAATEAIKNIRPNYKGISFRSRPVAQWAAFFDILGWEWDYRFGDLSGWDFVILGDERVCVKVVPAVEFPVSLSETISVIGCQYEVLILGECGPVADDDDWFRLGWLRDRESYSWAKAVLGRWESGNGAVGFCHSEQVFSDRISGGYDGGSFGDLPLAWEEIDRWWRAACERVPQ